MTKKERMTALVDRLIEAAAITAENDYDNGSDFLFTLAENIGAGDDEVRLATLRAGRAIRSLVERRAKARTRTRNHA